MIYCTRCKETKNKELFTCINTHSPRGLCKSCKAKQDKSYREKNKEKIKLYFAKYDKTPHRKKLSAVYREKRRCGINATEFVKNKVCEKCGMTNDEHKERYNERLHLHHKNNTGRHNQRLKIKPIHKDLQVLCRSCHVSEDSRNKDYRGIAEKAWVTRRFKYGIKGNKKSSKAMK